MKNLFYTLSICAALSVASIAPAAPPTAGQFLFQRKPVSGTGPFDQFGVTPTTNGIFGWDGSAVVMLSPAGGVTWGAITGTLSNQVDLQNAFNLKLSLAGVLPLAGFSSITGTLPDANLSSNVQLENGTLALAGFSSITGTLPVANIPATIQRTDGTLALAGFGSITGTLPSGNLPSIPDAKLSSNVQLEDGTLALDGFSSITGTLPAGRLPDLSGTYLTPAAAAAAYQPLDADLTAISALSGTNTVYYRSAANTWTPVTIGTGLSFGSGTLASTNAGTVTSVAMSVPSVLSVAGSPITSSGTLAISLATQTANRVWAGPTTGSAATPTFRSLVAADIPDISATYLTPAAGNLAYQPLDADLTALAALTGTNSLYYRSAANTWTPVSFGTGLNFGSGTLSTTLTGTVTSVGLTAPGIFSVSGSPVTTTGSLAFSLANQSANLVWAGPTTGSAAAPSFRSLVAADIPSLSGTYLTPAAAAAAYQPLDADLTAISALSGTNTIYYRSGANTWTGITVGSGLDFSGGTLTATSSGATVSSVGLSLPGIFSVSGSPVTTTGTLTASLATQTANRVWAGPTTGSAAAPTFRALVAGDVPDLSATYLTPAAGNAAYQPLDADLTALAALSGTNTIYYRSAANTWTGISIGSGLSFSSGTLDSNAVTSVGLTLPTSVFDVASSPVTSSGTIAATFDTQTANAFFGGPTSGAAATPAFRTLVPNDIPDISATYVSSAATRTANTVFAGPTTGSAAAPTFRALVAGDIPSLSSVYQPLDADLTALAALSGTNNIYYRSAANTWTSVTVGSGLSFSGGTLSNSASGIGGGTGSTDNVIIRADGTGGSTVQGGGVITLSDAGAFGLPDGVSQVFNPNGTNAGLNVGDVAGDPSAPANGDLWYDSTANELTARINGSNVALNSGGGGIGGSTGATDNILIRADGTGGSTIQGGGVIALSDTGALTFPDDVKQTFNPGSTTSGFNVGSLAGDPSSPANGDVWYDSTANELTARINGSSVALGSGGGGGIGGSTGATDNRVLRSDGTGGATLQNSGVTIDDSANITTTGKYSSNSSGAASTPVIALSGAWFTGGTSTTTKPQLLVEESGATSTGWSTSGTGLGVNAASGFAGNLFDLQLDGASMFKISSTGLATWTDGIRQTFNPNGTNAGLNVGSQAGDPSSPSNGDLWYDSTANELTARINGATVALGGSGTVTSVAASVPAFLSISGSPVTTSGTLAISYSGTALPVANGGTGATTSTGSGAVVLATSPTLVTPNIGAATSTTLAMSGALTNSVSGAASTPAAKLSGPWFTGGTGTTTKPQLLVEGNGATSTAWSTSGTGLGVNGGSGFTGLLADFQSNGTSRFKVDISGNAVLNGGALNFGSDVNVYRSGTNLVLDGGSAFTNLFYVDTFTDPDNVILSASNAFTFSSHVSTNSLSASTFTVSDTFTDAASSTGTVGQVLTINDSGNPNWLPPATNNTYTAYAAGTVYTLTATPALVDFGTTDPTVTLTTPGVYLIFGRANAKYNGATYASNQTVTTKLRRTNNTASDLPNGTTTATTRVITTITDTVGMMPMPPVVYVTANIDDVISVFGSVSATPSAGSVEITEASIIAIQIY